MPGAAVADPGLFALAPLQLLPHLAYSIGVELGARRAGGCAVRLRETGDGKS